MEEEDTSIPAGALVLDGRYRIVQKLGEGAMGVVYEARHTSIGRRVALKAVRPEYRRRADVLQRFEHEARAGGMFQHTGIVAVYDHGTDGKHGPMLAMEFLKGVDLADALNKGHFDLSERLRIFLKMLTALEVIHRGDIIHRDLKPENVFLALVDDRELVPKLADFGLARGHNQQLTRTGVMMGTPHYMSPEQATGSKDIDARTDIYAMGVMLYELLAGPITGDETLWGRLVTNPRSSEEELLQKPDMADAELWQLVVRAVRRDPAQRFQSAEEFATCVKQWAKMHSIEIDERDYIAFPPGLKSKLRATVHGCEGTPEPIHASLGMGPEEFDLPPVEPAAPAPRSATVGSWSGDRRGTIVPVIKRRWPIFAAAVAMFIIGGVAVVSLRQTTPLAPPLERVDAHSPRGATPPVTALALEPDAGVTPTPVVVAAPPVEPLTPPTEPTPATEAPSRGSRRRGGHSRHRNHREREASPPATTVVAAPTPSTPTCVWETLADGTRRRVCH